MLTLQAPGERLLNKSAAVTTKIRGDMNSHC